jgi:hypothetical protein
MVHNDGDLLLVVPMKTTPKSLPFGERLRLPKGTGSLMERPLQVRCSLSVVTASVNE